MQKLHMVVNALYHLGEGWKKFGSMTGLGRKCIHECPNLEWLTRKDTSTMATDIALTNLKIGIATNAQLFPVLIRLSGSDSGQPRADRNSGEVKTSPDGRATHKVAGKVV